MKKFLFLTLVSIIFIIPLSSYAAVSNEHYEETNIIVESEILTQAKIV